ncbi:unnamed protein product (macronuclear) [Paramecium tetraurelia]|uniref:Uncharacterized protein n=1 Tax=Paramecium tetraurelia TaxID=5888 RepID=A0DG51_PARTE|nr:uncharacterized protein GSPATT00002146001 [Paramecium tetraurelia]CAK82018.1 unnamed protein product [Paramecium tetraurelia]|eukprot:XP_001449415.1 hypothetical protein (macronuclear) [Paramecium tetraurelia strain d4-2]
MSVCNKNYLQETFPQYVDDQLNRVAEEDRNMDKSQRIFNIIDILSELKVLSFGLATKLKSQEGFMLFPQIISEKYIIEFKDIKSCKLRKNEPSYFQAWAFVNLELIDMYKLQTFLRILCILAYFECKKYFESFLVDYKSKYENDLFKVFLLLQTQKKEFQIEADNFFLQLIEKCECKNNQFISYMTKFCKEKNMLKCLGYLESIKSTNKVSSEKRKGFQKFKEELVKKESLQESQQTSQQIVIQPQNTSQIIKRHSSIFPRKSLDQQSHLIQFQESAKDLIKSIGMNRPSLTMRTMKDGINHKYKRENDNRQQRYIQSEISQQRQFHEEVCRKLEIVQRRRVACWNSDCLAPETPEIYSD